MAAPENMTISGCSTEKPVAYPTCYFNTACSNWTMDRQLHTIEFVTTKANRDALWNNIIPGKVDELDFNFTKKYYMDITYYSGNTIQVTPITGTHLADIRDEVKLVVKEYREELWGRPADTYYIKLSGYEYVPL